MTLTEMRENNIEYDYYKTVKFAREQVTFMNARTGDMSCYGFVIHEPLETVDGSHQVNTKLPLLIEFRKTSSDIYDPFENQIDLSAYSKKVSMSLDQFQEVRTWRSLIVPTGVDPTHPLHHYEGHHIVSFAWNDSVEEMPVKEFSALEDIYAAGSPLSPDRSATDISCSVTVRRLKTSYSNTFFHHRMPANMQEVTVLEYALLTVSESQRYPFNNAEGNGG